MVEGANLILLSRYGRFSMHFPSRNKPLSLLFLEQVLLNEENDYREIFEESPLETFWGI